jgi:hypothetical protein
MDKQLPSTQPATLSQNPSQSGQMPAKSDGTKWIILSIFALAILITGVAYFATSSKKPVSNPTQTDIIPTPTPREKAKWQTYTNSKYEYSFHYPITWEMTNISADQKKFELKHLDTKDPSLIKISYLSQDERSKMQPTFCETTTDLLRCHTYSLTTTSEALIDLIDGDNKGKVDALISHPNGGTFILQVTDPGLDSYDTLALVINTLKFPNEARMFGLQICPDSWPTTQKTIDYNGVKIATADVDTAWVKTNCKYP